MSLLELVEFAAERIRSFRVYFNAESRFVGGSLDRCVYAISEFFGVFIVFRADRYVDDLVVLGEISFFDGDIHNLLNGVVNGFALDSAFVI